MCDVSIVARIREIDNRGDNSRSQIFATLVVGGMASYLQWPSDRND